MLQKFFCMFCCGCPPLQVYSTFRSLPRWPTASLSSPSSLKDYTEGHPLRLAIWKLSRGAALIGPEIAEETRWDWVGSGVGVWEKVEGRLEGCFFSRFLYILPCVWRCVCALQRFKYFSSSGFLITTVLWGKWVKWLVLLCFFGLFYWIHVDLGFLPNGNRQPPLSNHTDSWSHCFTDFF